MRSTHPFWKSQLVIVAAVFVVLEFAIATVVFSGAPRRWSGSLVVALATGVGGVLSWGIVCGRRPDPAWWRATLAGMVGGVVLHPVYWLLEIWMQGEHVAVGLNHRFNVQSDFLWSHHNSGRRCGGHHVSRNWRLAEQATIGRTRPRQRLSFAVSGPSQRHQLIRCAPQQDVSGYHERTLAEAGGRIVPMLTTSRIAPATRSASAHVRRVHHHSPVR